MDGYVIELALDEARRWVDEAIAFYTATGREIALVEFSNPRGRFAKGEQYIYVLDSSGTMLAHGVNEKYLGKDFYRVQDVDGRNFIKEIVDIANAKGFGSVEYKWFDPATRMEQPKTVYFEKVDSMIFCSGVYRGNTVLGALEQPTHEDDVLEPGADSLSVPGHPATGVGTGEPLEEEVIELMPDDAKRWVGKAIGFCRANGKGIALAEFASPRGQFVRDEQYIYVLDINGTMLAHPVNEKYAGKDFYRIQDSDGKSFIKEIVDTANTTGTGWVEYRWYDPATRKEHPKNVYFERFDNMIFCSGIYERLPSATMSG
jgi:cytochrome c